MPVLVVTPPSQRMNCDGCATVMFTPLEWRLLGTDWHLFLRVLQLLLYHFGIPTYIHYVHTVPLVAL
jgi:hypothetical protein